MKQETASIRFLYGTVAGRCCLKVLVQPWVSKLAGSFLSSRLSRPIIAPYARRNHVDLTGYDTAQFHCFNDFFTRQRSIDDADTTVGHLVSPCDAYLTVYPIDEQSTYHIKHIDYSLSQLLGDRELAAQYAGGTCLIFRLTPTHYHRYCFCCNGRIRSNKRINGKLHCVRPLAYTTRPIFGENSREYVLIDSPCFGKVVQMEVGALLVGRIRNHPGKSQACQCAEKGCFEFGGSTIILLLEKDRVSLEPRFLHQPEVEKDVRYGQKIGVIGKHEETL